MKKLYLASTFFALIVGVVLIGSGVWGLVFTHASIAREDITTPSDAAIPNAPVRGPFTLKAQADIIRVHALRITGGQTYAEMPREVPALDADGEQVVDGDGNAVMVANTDRDIWITATTLITALNLGILTYAVFSLMIVIGLFSLWAGVIFCTLRKKMS